MSHSVTITRTITVPRQLSEPSTLLDIDLASVREPASAIVSGAETTDPDLSAQVFATRTVPCGAVGMVQPPAPLAPTVMLPAGEAPRPGDRPRRRLVVPLSMALVLAVALGFASRAEQPSADDVATERGERCDETLLLLEGAPLSIGNDAVAHCRAHTVQRLRWLVDAPAPMVLSFVPYGDVASAALQWRLNGTPLPPVATGSAGESAVLLLPSGVVLPGENVLSLDAPASGAWRLAELRVRRLSSGVDDVAQLSIAVERARRLLRQRDVAAGHRWRAAQALRAAQTLSLVHRLDADQQALLSALPPLERQLEQLCRRQLLTIRRQAEYGDDAGASVAMALLISTFPDSAHDCRARADRELADLQLDLAP